MLGWADRVEQEIKFSRHPKNKYLFLGSCVSLKGSSINEMQEKSKPVSLRTMRKYCDTKPFEEALGYVRNGEGLKLRNDWHVGFYKSWYEGVPVYYIEHSRIEYIWEKQ